MQAGVTPPAQEAPEIDAAKPTTIKTADSADGTKANDAG